MTKIDGLALRRRIAEAKGWTLPWQTNSGSLMGDEVPGRPGCIVPVWDSNPSAVLTLWAEMVEAGLHIDISDQLDEPIFDGEFQPAGTRAWENNDEIPEQVFVPVADEPDPVRRFCLALCLLWLSWHEARKVAA